MSPVTKRPVRRAGLSLLEVVLAMSILAGAMVVLSQLVGIGLRAAEAARDLTRAQILAETVASEIAAGVRPAATVSKMPLELDPGWVASIDVGSTPQDGVIQIVVTIEQEVDVRPARFELTRWMRDPSLPLPTDDAALEEAGGTSGSSADDGGRA